jgi:hypothetical protein
MRKRLSRKPTAKLKMKSEGSFSHFKDTISTPLGHENRPFVSQ